MVRRNTIQKELALRAVLELKNHITADEAYDYIVKEYPSISKATVYRNLNLLAEEGKIRKTVISGEPDRYDHTLEKHHHAKCIKCGRIYDINAKISVDTDAASKESGFFIQDYDIVFKGICCGCCAKEKAAINIKVSKPVLHTAF